MKMHCGKGLAALAIVIGSCTFSLADVFYPIDGVTVTYPGASGPYWPESNLIQGAGIGFDFDAPHDKLLGGAEGNWVTLADAGYPSDYIEDVGMPIIELDLGQDRLLSEISTWGYAETNTNGLREFSLRFATDAEGMGNYGTSITYNPSFLIEDFYDFTDFERQSFDFDGNAVTARYVEMTLLDNFFEEPGDGTGEELWPAGGDRVGIGEIAFQAPDGFEPPDPPEPIEFYPIDDIYASTGDFDLYPAINLIQGPGVGFLENEPYSLTSGGADGLWVTEDCGFPCDYLEDFDPPELIVDLGEDVELDEINIWGYSAGNSNGVREFELEFATDADGDDGFGDSISYNPSFDEVDINPTPRQIFPFDETVTARYVKITVTDNYFEDPGDGSGENGWPAGGDRVGMGEIAFPLPGQGGGLLGDFDGDGALDVDDINLLVGESAAGAGAGEFDLTGDSMVDQDDITVWVNELKGTWIGDSDLDGEFNSGDLVAVFTTGKFENGETANWSEGDWTGDGFFDSSDFVFAFQSGGYEQGPRVAVAAVPEPSTAIMTLIATFALATSRRKR